MLLLSSTVSSIIDIIFQLQHCTPPTDSLTEVATGRSEVPYDNLQHLGVQVYGMPTGIPFHSPLLYTQQQLQQILANLEKIVFLKVGPQVSGWGSNNVIIIMSSLRCRRRCPAWLMWT